MFVPSLILTQQFCGLARLRAADRYRASRTKQQSSLTTKHQNHENNHEIVQQIFDPDPSHPLSGMQ